MGSLPSTKSGNGVLKEIVLPDHADPGETVEMTVKVKNRAVYINPWDPDRCNNPAAGYKMRAGVELPDGSTRDLEEKCVTGDFSTYQWTTTFTVPEEKGDHPVSVWVEMTGSGKRTDELTRYISVTSVPPQTGDDGGSDDGGSGFPWQDDGDDGNDDSDSNPFTPDLGLGEQTSLAMGVLALLAIAWLASSTSDVVS